MPESSVHRIVSDCAYAQKKKGKSTRRRRRGRKRNEQCDVGILRENYFQNITNNWSGFKITRN